MNTTEFSERYLKMIEEDKEMQHLEHYISILKTDLEVEVDLYGGRTEMARNLRNLIIAGQKQMACLKAGAVTDFTIFGVVYRYTV